MYDFFSHSNDHLGGTLQVPGSLGPEYLLNDSHQLVGHASVQGKTGGSSVGFAAVQGSPSSTLVGSPAGLEINLVWDASIKGASNWSAIEAAVVSAAQVYTTAFANPVTINIAVGLGEIAGSSMGAGALGESESAGYLVGYSTLTHALGVADSALVNGGLMSSHAVTADTALGGATFFVPSAEAKAIGLTSPHSTAIDGYIGLTQTGSTLYFPANGGPIKANQYDAVGVAAHELSEVMGRIGLEGASLGSGTHAYSALDLFRYLSPGVADLKPSVGYFSTNLGLTNFGLFNDPSNGGDAADLAALSSTNAYNAFGTPGVLTQVTAADLLAVASLGYQVAGARLATVNA